MKKLFGQIEKNEDNKNNIKLFNIFYTSEAQKNIDEIEDFYDSKQENLSGKFVNNVQETLELLKQHPEMYTRYEKEIRKGNVKGFPYSFYYENDMPEELVNVLGVFAQAKNPKSIRRTLASRIKWRKL